MATITMVVNNNECKNYVDSNDNCIEDDIIVISHTFTVGSGMLTAREVSLDWLKKHDIHDTADILGKLILYIILNN